MKKTTYSVNLPWFPGFYYSRLDSLIDDEVESEMQESGETWDEVDKRANYQAARVAICKAWVKAFAEESGVAMEYEEISSPKEYNFTTDRVFVTITQAELDKIKVARTETLPMSNSSAFKDVLAEWFTSRDGFMSFYSNEPEDDEWCKPVEEWDHNQLSALLAAYILTEHNKEDFIETLYEDSNVSEAAQHVWDAKEKK